MHICHLILFLILVIFFRCIHTRMQTLRYRALGALATTITSAGMATITTTVKVAWPKGQKMVGKGGALGGWLGPARLAFVPAFAAALVCV